MFNRSGGRSAILLLSMVLLLCSACACSSTRPDASAAVHEGVAAAGGGKSEQSQGHLGLGGLAIAEDGNATGGATTRLGVDVQGAANAAANPVTINPLTGDSAAAGRILSSTTPEEAALAVRLERIQAALRRAQEDLDLSDGAGKPAIGARIAELEAKEASAMDRMGVLYRQKLDAAAKLVPDLSALASVHYAIFAPQITTSGKAMTDAQSEATAAAFRAWMEAQRVEAPAPAAAGGGN